MKVTFPLKVDGGHHSNLTEVLEEALDWVTALYNF